jgi:sigma-B regulation protein RsbU (phosphoserine phosphatase)
MPEGMALSVLPMQSYPQHCIDLEDGDVLFFYTDGVNEAINSKFEEFGIEAIQTILEENAQDSIDVIGKNIIKSVEIFEDGTPQADDLTILIAKIYLRR